ncbi:hypothetical protein Zmor_022798 [Zophobas morio]|uniref:Uncharacterized protein n=1 Tax=Zophobas morio TaxID=2755281 RepID=A0AA38M6E4_9CUCU|nr:hypothetical protein Zmor_022798 [Zophobas morio]
MFVFADRSSRSATLAAEVIPLPLSYTGCFSRDGDHQAVSGTHWVVGGFGCCHRGGRLLLVSMVNDSAVSGGDRFQSRALLISARLADLPRPSMANYLT